MFQKSDTAINMKHHNTKETLKTLPELNLTLSLNPINAKIHLEDIHSK